MSDGKEYLEHFDKIFGTDVIKHIDFKNFKLLHTIFNYFGEDVYKTSPKYESIRQEYIQSLNKLKSTFTDEQEELFNKCDNLNNSKTKELEEQLFMFGYIMGSELKSEIELGVNKDNG